MKYPLSTHTILIAPTLYSRGASHKYCDYILPIRPSPRQYMRGDDAYKYHHNNFSKVYCYFASAVTIYEKRFLYLRGCNLTTPTTVYEETLFFKWLYSYIFGIPMTIHERSCSSMNRYVIILFPFVLTVKAVHRTIAVSGGKAYIYFCFFTFSQFHFNFLIFPRQYMKGLLIVINVQSVISAFSFSTSHGSLP